MNDEAFSPHSLKQDRALSSNKRIVLVATGTQWGKTSVGAVRMMLKMHDHTNPTDNFLITAPTYKVLYQSTLPPFLRLMEGLGRVDGKHECFRMKNGGTAWFRTEKDPDSIIGITNVRHIWGDEAGKYRLYFWQNMQARADFKGATIDLTTSPYSLNWVYKELIKPWLAGNRPDIEYVKAASWENPYHSLANPDRLKQKRGEMDERRFNMIYGGEFTRMEGLVYDCWDDDENNIDEFQLPVGTKYMGGIDWGYHPDPFVVKIRAITPDGKHYGVSEFVKTRLTITDIVSLLKQKNTIFGVKTYYCDPSQPGYIEELNRNGITAIGADNDIRRGIDLHYELIKTRRYKEFRGTCPHSTDERESYHYPEPKDLGVDQGSKELNPVDAGNHCMDADRYLTMHTAHIGDVKKAPKMPGEMPRTMEYSLKRLQKRSIDRKSENVNDM